MMACSHRTVCLVQDAVLYQNVWRNIFDSIPPIPLLETSSTIGGGHKGAAIPLYRRMAILTSALCALILTQLPNVYVCLVYYSEQLRDWHVGRTLQALHHHVQHASPMRKCARCGATLPQCRRTHARLAQSCASLECVNVCHPDALIRHIAR